VGGTSVPDSTVAAPQAVTYLESKRYTGHHCLKYPGFIPNIQLDEIAPYGTASIIAEQTRAQEHLTDRNGLQAEVYDGTKSCLCTRTEG
jgi:hypothetical protein